MPVVLANDPGERVLLYGSDGATLRALVADASGRLVIVGPGAGGATVVSATDLDVRNLTKTLDELYAVLRTDAGVAYDARTRSWTITETVPVSAASLPLPTGAATAANQSTAITALQLIDDLRTALGSVATDRLNVQTAGLTDRVAVSDPRERAPATLLSVYRANGVAPHAFQSRWNYTVPANRAALVSIAEVRIIRDGATATPGAMEAAIRITPTGGAIADSIWAGIWTGVLGDQQFFTVAPNLWLEAGDRIDGFTADTSTGGTGSYFVGATLTEITA
jgi:hypothetical protein